MARRKARLDFPVKVRNDEIRMTSPACLSCQIASGVSTPPGGWLERGALFNAHQDMGHPIPGFIIIASERHFKHWDEMTEAESADLAAMIRRVRRAQREALGIDVVYYFYNEDTRHHFHLWLVPRYAWMERFGKSVAAVGPALDYADRHFNDEEGRRAVADSIQKIRLFWGA